MLRSIDVPQANALETVRQVVYAIDRGICRLEELADFTGFSVRHTGYRVHAARILGLVRLVDDEASITALGERLLCTDPKSTKERSVFYDAIVGSACTASRSRSTFIGAAQHGDHYLSLVRTNQAKRINGSETRWRIIGMAPIRLRRGGKTNTART